MTCVAAIDIGTNSTNLLIINSLTGVAERRVTVTRLGAGVDKTRTLSVAAVNTTLQCLKSYRKIIGANDVQKLRVTASSACRDATNHLDFFSQVHEILGTQPELLSGTDEGRLSYLGSTKGLALDPQGHIVIDIGGGSTELMLGTSGLDTVRSIDVGAVRLTERYLGHDPPHPEELLNAIGNVQDLLDDVIREVPAMSGVSQFIGTAGTIVTMAAIELGQLTFDSVALHGFVLTREAIEDVFRTLATEPFKDRIHNPGLPRERADIIVGGCCVLVALMRKWDADSVTVSTHNILDGICAELLETT